MNIAFFFMMALQAMADIHAERSVAVLTNATGIRRIASQIRSRRLRRIFTQVYMQCAAGFRDIETDPLCQKLAMIMIHDAHFNGNHTATG